jgi:ABC-type sugar transport system substrate-binding protein
MMGYKGCEFAISALNGEELPKYVYTDVKVVKKEDVVEK